MRYVVVDSGGVILRSGYSPEPALQAGVGETAYVLESADGGLISDENLTVTDGEFAAVGGYSAPLPAGTLALAVEP